MEKNEEKKATNKKLLDEIKSDDSNVKLCPISSF
jgi:hypothetical protein